MQGLVSVTGGAFQEILGEILTMRFGIRGEAPESWPEAVLHFGCDRSNLYCCNTKVDFCMGVKVSNHGDFAVAPQGI